MKTPRSLIGTSRLTLVGAIAVATLALSPQISSADESGVSFWVPGQFGSLAAVPATPGWSLGAIYYHVSVAASADVAAASQVRVGRIPPNVNVNLSVNLNSPADILYLAPTYTFATPVLGGQLAIGVTGVFGPDSTDPGWHADDGVWSLRDHPYGKLSGLGRRVWRPLPDDHTEVE